MHRTARTQPRGPLTPTRVSVGTFTIRPDVPRDAAAPMNSMLLSGTKSRRGFSDAANI